MNKITKITGLAFLFLFAFAINSFSQGYEIQVTIKGMENQNLNMGHYYADKTYVKDTVMTDSKGLAIFKGDKKIDGGIYFIVLPGKTIAWEFLLTDDQEFSMSSDTSNYLDNLVITGSKENDLYLEYSRFMRDNNRAMSVFQDQLKDAKDDPKKKELVMKDVEVLQKSVKSQWKKYIADNPGTFFKNIINAQMFPEAPEFKIDESIANKDSMKQVLTYYYNKKHFFDGIDFSDSKLLRTAYLNSRLQTYFTKLVFNPDTIIKDGDVIIERASMNDDVFRFVVEYMLNLKYETNRMGMDKVLVHVGEKYYLSGRATWVDSTRMDKIQDRIIKTLPNLVGQKSADMKVITHDNKIVNLHQINTDYTILVFWEPDCGHCRKTLPKLHDIYTHLKWDLEWSIEVMAVFTQVKEFDKWVEFIEEHAMDDWINAYDPYGWSKFRDNYDIYSTPVIYILNKEKEIIAKRLDVEKIEEFIEGWEKFNK